MISKTEIDNLYKILEEEYLLYKELVDLFKKEKEAIMDDNIDLLNKLVIEEEEKASKIRFLEEGRMEIVSHNKALPKLDDVIRELSPSEQEKFSVLKKGLFEAINELRNLKETNELLINRTLKYLRFYIELLSKETGSFVYREDGILDFNKENMNKLDERV